MVNRFGTPTWFFTFAPDYNDPFTIRLSVIANRSRSSETPPGFPAEDGGFMAALRDWDERGRPESTVFELGFENTFTISNPILRNIICEGGTARANIYLSIKKAIFKALFGIEEDQDIKKTVPLSSRPDGIFGQTRALLWSTDCQGRGDLHGHIMVWTVLTPKLLQFVAGKLRLAPIMSELIDTMITSCRSLEDNITSVIRTTMNQQPLCAIWQHQPDPVNGSDDGSDDFKKLIAIVMMAVQFHCHSDTCKKGPRGQYQCRLNFGRVHAEHTRPIELILDPIEQEILGDGDALTGAQAAWLEIIRTSNTNRDIALNHTLRVEEQVSEFTREQPNWERSVMPRNDPRNIYWETRRPLFSVDKIFLNNELHPDLQNILTQDVIDKMLQFTPAQRIKFVEMIAKRNCYCVECSPTASACLCCNSNASLLGASEQARATLYYLIQYIVKDAVPLVHAVALAAAARRHIDTYPSVAEDCDSAERRAKYFVQRLTNSLTGLTEVSAPQAAASLMGLSSMVSTTHTPFCFIKGAMHFQDTLRLEGDEIMYENNNDYLSYIMNDEITVVQDNDLHLDTDDNNVDSILDPFEDELTYYIDQPDDDNNDSSNIFDMDIADNIDQPEDDPDNDNDDSNNGFDMDIADIVDQIEDDNDDFSVDAIALDGATPAITNLLIHGIIDQAGDMPMPPVCDNYERATDELSWSTLLMVNVYLLNHTYTTGTEVMIQKCVAMRSFNTPVVLQ